MNRLTILDDGLEHTLCVMGSAIAAVLCTTNM